MTEAASLDIGEDKEEGDNKMFDKEEDNKMGRAEGGQAGWHYLRHGSALASLPCFNFVGQVGLSPVSTFLPRPHIPAFLAAP